MRKTKDIKTIILLTLSLGLICMLSSCDNTQQNLTEAEKALHRESLEKFARPDRWDETIKKFKEMDQKNPPPQGAVLFVGSSSIVGWDTKKWFPDIVNINRGFGGSQINDALYYADDIIIPYKPRAIVFYSGDNDTADGKTPQMIYADFKALMLKLRQSLPQTKIIIISIKPSIDRWHLWPKMQQANDMIRKYCENHPNTYFIDVSKVMLDSSGQPRKEIFSPDGLHMNETGYELWTSLVRPYIIDDKSN